MQLDTTIMINIQQATDSIVCDPMKRSEHCITVYTYSLINIKEFGRNLYDSTYSRAKLFIISVRF